MNGYNDRNFASDPPPWYSQSRAALRDRFGTRTIDARAPMADPRLNKGAVDAGSGIGAANRWGGMFKNSTWAAGIPSSETYNPERAIAPVASRATRAPLTGLWSEMATGLWFRGNPGAGQPTQYGDNFLSKYGRGEVTRPGMKPTLFSEEWLRPARLAKPAGLARPRQGGYA